MVTNGLHRSKHCIEISYRISDQSYGGDNTFLGGTWQGNMLSGCVCRDVSCFMLKELEKKDWGCWWSWNMMKEVQRVEIAFVDDSDFCTKGDESETKMQEIVDFYASMNEATGGKIQ